MQQIEALLVRLEAGQLPLEELLAEYQKGAVLLKYCQECLNAVQQQVKLVDGGSVPVGAAEQELL